MGAFWSMKKSRSASIYASLLAVYVNSDCCFVNSENWRSQIPRQKLPVNLRSVFITAVKDQKRIRFSKEVLLIQLVATELQHHRLLKRRKVTKILDVMQPQVVNNDTQS